MKRFLCCLLLLTALLTLCPGAGADYDQNLDYLSILCRAAACGDLDAGRAAAECWNESLGKSGSRQPRLDFDELLLLAKLIQSEGGDDRLGLEWRMCIGEVALNRVASPEFPDTLEEVVFQPGQYEGVDSERFRTFLDPDELSVEAALQLLQGERHLAPWVVFQANFRQGGGVYAAYYDRVYGYTYFCSTSHPELY